MNKEVNVHMLRIVGYGLTSLFLLIHIGMYLLFRYYGVTPMARFNIFSIAFYLFTLPMLKWESLWLYSVSVYLEVMAHMSLAVCFVGLAGGFQVTLIGMTALAFYAEYMSINLKGKRVPGIILCVLGMLAYLASYVYSQCFPSAYELPQQICFWMQIAWAVIVFSANIFFLNLFVMSTVQSERTYQVVQVLAEAIEAKDHYTNGHSGRVAKYAREIAKRAGMSEKAQKEIFMMGLLHDVGKIGVPDVVIKKAGRLTNEEFELIKSHTEIGAKILQEIEEMPELAFGAHWHHERIDGKGYPAGLKGDRIPPEARIIAVADAYDAMTSNRSYREAMPQSQVREEIEKGLSTQFDPKYGRIMIQMIDEDTEYQLRER